MVRIYCCLYCGRDTRSVSQICFRCCGNSHKRYASQINDTKDRNQLPMAYIDLDDIDEGRGEDYWSKAGEESTDRFIKRMNRKLE